MSDLTAAQWRSVVDESIYLPADGSRHVGRYIAVDKLREIIRKRRRSLDQNALAWVLYQQILDRGGEAMRGWSTQDLHDFFLIQHFGADTIEAFGMKRLKPKRRSSRLTKMEFSDYLETIVRFMAEQGVVLSMPEDKAA